LLIDGEICRWSGARSALTGFFLTSFTIFDLLGRTIYIRLVELSAVSVGAVLIAACLVRIRWKGLA
jgi:hypothetical protein